MNNSAGKLFREAQGLYEKYDYLCRLGHREIRRFKGVLKGEPVFILGNGPSLKRVPHDVLEGLNFIATNRGFHKLESVRTSFHVNLLTDETRVEELSSELVDIGGKTFVAPDQLTKRFIANQYVRDHFSVLRFPMIFDLAENTPHMYARESSRSSLNLESCLDNCGRSVAFSAIQLAYYLGADEIVLLGNEMDYSGESTHFVDGVTHLNKSFDYEIDARGPLLAFKDLLNSRGVRLSDATTGGKIDVLPKDDLVVAANRARMRQKHIRPIKHRAMLTSSDFDRLIWVWGTGDGARRVYSLLNSWGIEVSGFIDGLSKFDKGEFLGKPIKGTGFLNSFNDEVKPYFVIGSSYLTEIETYLSSIGFTPVVDYSTAIFEGM